MVLNCGKCGSDLKTHLYQISLNKVNCLCKKCYQNWRDRGSLWAITNDNPFLWVGEDVNLSETPNPYPIAKDMDKLYEEVETKLSHENKQLLDKWLITINSDEIKEWIDSNFSNATNHIKYLISQIIDSIIINKKL